MIAPANAPAITLSWVGNRGDATHSRRPGRLVGKVCLLPREAPYTTSSQTGPAGGFHGESQINTS